MTGRSIIHDGLPRDHPRCRHSPEFGLPSSVLTNLTSNSHVVLFLGQAVQCTTDSALISCSNSHRITPGFNFRVPGDEFDAPLTCLQTLERWPLRLLVATVAPTEYYQYSSESTPLSDVKHYGRLLRNLCQGFPGVLTVPMTVSFFGGLFRARASHTL